jgi:hypothetical protein
MEAHLGVFLQPALVLLVGIEVVEADVKLAIREGSNKAVHVAEGSSILVDNPASLSSDFRADSTLYRQRGETLLWSLQRFCAAIRWL